MPGYSLRIDGLYDEALDALVELPDAAAAERAAIQMLAELRMNAGLAAAEGVRRVAVHDAAGRPVMDVTLNIFTRQTP